LRFEKSYWPEFTDQTAIGGINHYQKPCDKSPSFCLVEQSETTLRFEGN